MDFVLFVDYVIIGVDLRIFGRGHRALSANPTSHVLTQVFFGNKTIIRVFRGFDRLSSVSGAKIRLKKQIFGKK